MQNNEEQKQEQEIMEENILINGLTFCCELIPSYSKYLVDTNNHNELRKMFLHIDQYFRNVPENIKIDFERMCAEKTEQDEKYENEYISKCNQELHVMEDEFAEQQRLNKEYSLLLTAEFDKLRTNKSKKSKSKSKSTTQI